MMFDGAIRRLVLVGLVSVATAVIVPAAIAAGPPRVVTCPEYNANDPTDSTVYQGTAMNLFVPAGHECVMYGADISHDVTLESGSLFGAISSTIGHDLVSHGAAVISTGVYQTLGGKGPGPVVVGDNITLKGSSFNLDFCDTTVVHDFKVNGLKNAYELQIGDTSKNNLDYVDNFYSCQGGPGFSLSPPVTINHDLKITNSTVGLLDVSNDSIGHNLVVKNDVATYATEGYLPSEQGMWVANNSIGNNATCLGDSPALGNAGPDAAQNTAGRHNNCKF
ncbi:MAG TPA: hypothetical protein VLZ06_09555 [Solirubrobacteraceae bacterium]|nr:hypothetical protein [Solirubrobacteraceae bacterium]